MIEFGGSDAFHRHRGQHERQGPEDGALRRWRWTTVATFSPIATEVSWDMGLGGAVIDQPQSSNRKSHSGKIVDNCTELDARVAASPKSSESCQKQP